MITLVLVLRHSIENRSISREHLPRPYLHKFSFMVIIILASAVFVRCSLTFWRVLTIFTYSSSALPKSPFLLWCHTSNISILDGWHQLSDNTEFTAIYEGGLGQSGTETQFKGVITIIIKLKVNVKSWLLIEIKMYIIILFKTKMIHHLVKDVLVLYIDTMETCSTLNGSHLKCNT